MVSIKFTTLLLGLFTTCFFLVASFHQMYGDVHLGELADAAIDVVASPEGVVTRVGERKILFGETKFLRDDIKAEVDGSSYKINNNGGSKSSSSSGAIQHEMNVIKYDQSRAKRSGTKSISQRKMKIKAGKSTSSLKPSDHGSISHLNNQVKSAVVDVSKSRLSSRNEPAVSQAKSKNKEDEVQKFQNIAASQLVMNLLHKDYGGMDKTHRRPPVHNGEPFH